jgi:hypothetical protein
MARSRRQTLVAAVSLALGAAQAGAEPVVPGFVVSPYAAVTDPTTIAFAADGTLYTGRDDFGSGNASGDVVKIHRIAPGGAPVEEYGEAGIPDPDGVLVDATGAFSGEPAAVLVCQGDVSPQQGSVLAILADQSIETVFGPLTTLQNPNQMVFDSTGALLVSSSSPQVGVHRATPGGSLSLFIDTSPLTAGEIAVDGAGRLFVFLGNGSVSVYDAAGVLETGGFTSGLGTYAALAFGPGGEFGTDLYATEYDTGELVRIDAQGMQTVVGTGFTTPYDLAFGPDGALYVSEFGLDRVVRIVSAAPTTTTVTTTSTTTAVPTTTLATTTTTVPTTSTSTPSTSSSTSSSLAAPTTSTITSTSTSSTSTTLPSGCAGVADGPTFPSVRCRIDDLLGRVNGEGGLGTFQAKLAKQLERASDRLDEAEVRCGEGNVKKARKRLQQTRKAVVQYVHRLGSRAARARLDDALRLDFLDAGEATLPDVETLRADLACPPVAT